MKDIIIIGGGVAGLMAAYKLSKIGLSVAVVEHHQFLASGPSTRNEGWLHRGTYHAASIASRETAVEVAKRCIYGHEQLKSFCPEAIEDMDKSPIAMLKDGDRAEEVKSRWKEAKVSFREISRREAKVSCPEADLSRPAALFEVNDVSINTRLLYRKLVSEAKRSGCEFFLDRKITKIDGTCLELCTSTGQRERIVGRKVVYAAGGGAADLMKKHHGINVPIRYWKSHLVVTKRLASMGVFYLDPQEAAMMHHGQVSVVGFNEDALLSEYPDYGVIKERARNLREGIKRIFPNWRANEALDVACVKVDLADQQEDARSLNIAIREPIPDHILALPGKLTEAPYLTDILVARIHEGIDDGIVSHRPCDTFQSVAEGV